MKIAVGSKNPVKIAAVRDAFERVFPDVPWEVSGVDVASEVSNQPMSDVESITGARNRARKAKQALRADYGVGLEGGIQEINGMWFDGGWVVVIDKNEVEGIGSSVKMPVPQKIMDLIHQGIELGVADDKIFNKTNSKHAEGHFGIMTRNAITRTRGYTDGVIAALTRFIHLKIFES